jgi:hypothetical protein
MVSIKKSWGSEDFTFNFFSLQLPKTEIIMARKTRIEDAGFHHILNRGIQRRVIFDTTKDKEKIYRQG